MSQSPPDVLGKYQIIREIARSNDIVYEGYDPVMNRRVAVKELAVPSGATTQQKDDRIKRFMREAKAAGSLVHPNIVTVYDVAEQSGRYYLAMEFLDGQNLRKTLEEQGTIPTDKAIEITIEIAKALVFAHNHGVVHRDVKPENIQILANGAIKLTDFGIARLTFEPNITMDGQVFGTPSYMSPEQINGRDIDARSDIFSLGIILYEMLAGKKPFTGDSVVSITYAIMNAEPAPINGLNSMVWQVVTKALDKTPQLRQSSCEQFITELKTALRSLNDLVLDPNPHYATPPPQNPNNPQAYNQLLNSPVTPYGTPNPLYNPNQAAIAQMGQPPPPTNQYQYSQPAPQSGVIYAPYSPYPQPQTGQAPPGNPYPQAYSGALAPPSQIPVYYPPPPKKPLVTISPEASANIARFAAAFLILGGICGLLVYGLNSISEASTEFAENSARTQPRTPAPAKPSQTTNTQPAQPTESNQSQPTEPERVIRNPLPTGDPNTLTLDAETLVDQGANTSTARTRHEFWRDANEKFRDAILLAPDQDGQIKSRAIQRYQQASANLSVSGNPTAAREALYQALSFASDPTTQQQIQSQINQLGG